MRCLRRQSGCRKLLSELLLLLLLWGGVAGREHKQKNATTEDVLPPVAEFVIGPNLDLAREEKGRAVVGNSKSFRLAIEDPGVKVILLASDLQLRRDIWPEVPRHLPELNLVVKRNLTITTHPALPFTAMLDLDFMENRVAAASGVTIILTGLVMSRVSRDPLSYLTVPFFQFEPNGVVMLENCQYQIAIEPSRLGPLGIYPSKIATTARPEGFEDWPVKMQLMSAVECRSNIVRDATCEEGGLWVGSLSARATVFDWNYKPMGKAAFLLKNVFMVAINLDKETPKTSDELFPGSKTVTVTDSQGLKDGFLDVNVTLMYIADSFVVDKEVLPSGSQFDVSRNVSITSHPSLGSPAAIDLAYSKDVVMAGFGTLVSIHNLRFSNTSTEADTFELIPFFRFHPESIFSYKNIVSEMVLSTKINMLSHLPFVLYGGQSPSRFGNLKTNVTTVSNDWCKSERGIECKDGALWIREGVRRVQVFQGESFVGNGFIVARDFLAIAIKEAAMESNVPGGSPGAMVASRNTSEFPALVSNPPEPEKPQEATTETNPADHMTVVVYILAGTVIIIVALLVAVFFLWRGSKHKSSKFVASKSSTTPSVGEELLLEHQHVAQQLLGDIKLGALLGWGSFGRVYKGLWGGAQVAVKVILHQAVGAEIEEVEQEANFSVTLRHPNVVQTFDYATRDIRIDPHVVGSASGISPPGITPNQSKGSQQVSSSRFSGKRSNPANDKQSINTSRHNALGMQLPSSWMNSAAKPKLSDSGNTMNSTIQSWYSNSRRPKGGASSQMTNSRPYEAWKETWLVQEYCELGSLGKQNILRANKLPSAWGTGDPDMLGIIQTCMDIARGMKYLHDNKVVHGDLKCDNVLLQRAAGSARGFTAKVADFGLSRQLQQNGAHMSTKSYGTITHMPPELLLNGHLSTKVDVYSFAIIMWELVSGEPPFKTLRHAEVMRTVVVDDTRPIFPDGSPGEYIALAARCWDRDPSLRPSFNGVLTQLDILSQIAAECSASGAGCQSPASTVHEFGPVVLTDGARRHDDNGNRLSYGSSGYSGRHS